MTFWAFWGPKRSISWIELIETATQRGTRVGFATCGVILWQGSGMVKTGMAVRR
jgi:hypothetical protein